VRRPSFHRARQEPPFFAMAICGVHLEGLWISLENGPRGAHDSRCIRTLDFIEKITAQRVIATIGHTSASPAQIRDAIAAGCTLSTHLGNGSHAMLSRLRNCLWE